jgi:hypothetical protein
VVFIASLEENRLIFIFKILRQQFPQKKKHDCQAPPKTYGHRVPERYAKRHAPPVRRFFLQSF